MVERLAVPKPAAMVGNVGAAARWWTVAEEVAAVAEQDADGVEEDCDVLGHGVAGAILRRIGRRGWMVVSGVGFHGSRDNRSLERRQGMISQLHLCIAD